MNERLLHRGVSEVYKEGGKTFLGLALLPPKRDFWKPPHPPKGKTTLGPKVGLNIRNHLRKRGGKRGEAVVRIQLDKTSKGVSQSMSREHCRHSFLSAPGKKEKKPAGRGKPLNRKEGSLEDKKCSSV